MIYETKEKAEAAADAFAIGQLNKGAFVQKYRRENRIEIRYGINEDVGPWTNESFKFVNVENDQLVWVRSGNDREWFPRYATGCSECGMIECWINGATSKTTERRTTWAQYRLPDPA